MRNIGREIGREGEAMEGGQRERERVDRKMSECD